MTEEQLNDMKDDLVDELMEAEPAKQAMQEVEERTGLSDEELNAILKTDIPIPENYLNQEQILESVGRIVAMGDELGEQAYDYIQNGDWRGLSELVSVNGVKISSDDINAVKDLGQIAIDVASAARGMGSAIYSAFDKANKSDNFSETMMLGLIEAAIDKAKEGGVDAEPYIRLISYLTGGNSDIATLMRERSVETVTNAIINFLTGKLDPKGGKFGLDLPTSYALSILLNLVPEGYNRSIFLAGLASLMEERRILQMAGTFDAPEVATFVADWLIRLINEVSGEPVAMTMGGAQVVSTDGGKTNWWLFPFSSGIIAIAASPVAGPDVRLVWNKWSQTTKTALAWVNEIPWFGDTLVQLANAGATQETFKALMSGIEAMGSTEDNLKAYFWTIAQKIADKGASMVAKYLRKNASKLKDKMSNKAQSVKQRIRDFFNDLTKDSGTVQEVSDVAEPAVGTPSYNNDEALQQSSQSDAVSLEGIKDMFSDSIEHYQETEGVEPWFTGKKPVTPGHMY